MTITFDMDGTLADFYSVPHWLEALQNEETAPYAEARPLLCLSALAKRLNTLQRLGCKIAVCSWLSRGGSAEYNERVTAVKLEWLARHLPSVHWDDINIIPYGTPKNNYCSAPDDVLFDDEARNREAWGGYAYTENEIFSVLAQIAQKKA